MRKACLVYVLIVLYSCRNEVPNKKSVELWDFGNQKNLNVYTLNSDLMLKDPCDIQIWRNYIIIYDKGNLEHLLHMYSLDGQKITEFCRVGKGPGEVASPTDQDLQILEEEGILVYQDKHAKRLIYFNIGHILNNDKPTFEERNLPQNNFYINTFLLKNGDFVNFENINTNRQHRFVRLDSIYKIKGEYILFKSNLGDKQNKHEKLRCTNFFHTTINPENTLIAFSTKIGILLEIFNINYDHDSISLVTSQNLNPGSLTTLPILSGKFDLPMPAKQGLLGFQDIYATQTSIYGILLNRTFEENLSYSPNKIISFNWQGRPITEFSTGIYLSAIAVSENKEFYVIAVNKNGEFELNKLK